MKFFSTKARGWPKNYSTGKLIQNVRGNTVKWTYTNKAIDEEQVLQKTERGEMKMISCFFLVEDDEFRKIKSGLIQERSPLENRDPRLKRISRYKAVYKDYPT